MYNYVILNDGFNELGDMLFKDLENRDNTIIINKKRVFSNIFIQKLFYLLFSFKVNNIVQIPLKRLFYKYIIKDFNNDSKTIYLLTSSWYFPSLIEYIKNADKNNKVAFYFGDTVISKKRIIKNLDLEYLKRKCDFVGSYNPDDVKKYGLTYLPMCYSKFSNLDELPKYDDIDILFIGASRNRLETIVDTYKQIKELDLKTFYYVVSSESITLDNNSSDFVCTDTPLSYREYLGHVMSTKCILEIVDPESRGGTLRFWDAVMYDKMLITNNDEVLKSKYYDSNSIIYTKDFDISYIDGAVLNNIISYKYNGDNSPVAFMNNIERYLEEL